MIKIFALVFMIIDHSAAVFDDYLPIWFRFIGRMAFPIYSFLIAQGCKYTKNIKKYLTRLAILAIISEVPYDLAFNKVYGTYSINFFNNLNTVFTLFIGVLTVYFFQEISKFHKQKILIFIVIVFNMIIAELLQTDYGGFGVLLIFCFYITDKRIKQITYFILLCVIDYYEVIIGCILQIVGFYNEEFVIYVSGFNLSLIIFTMLAAIFIFFYNGKQGIKSKHLFYVFYPLHLIIIVLIEYYLKR